MNMSRVERTLAETVCIFRSPDLRIISCQLEVCHPLLPLPQPITHICKDRSNFPAEFARNASSDESLELFLQSCIRKIKLFFSTVIRFLCSRQLVHYSFVLLFASNENTTDEPASFWLKFILFYYTTSVLKSCYTLGKGIFLHTLCANTNLPTWPAASLKYTAINYNPTGNNHGDSNVFMIG